MEHRGCTSRLVLSDFRFEVEHLSLFDYKVENFIDITFFCVESLMWRRTPTWTEQLIIARTVSGLTNKRTKNFSYVYTAYKGLILRDHTLKNKFEMF